MRLTKNRIVEYGIGREYNGEVRFRPAIVVEDWGGQEDVDAHPNLQVFLDGSNDRAAIMNSAENETWAAPTDAEFTRGLMWKTSVPFGEGVGCWRWPKKV